MTKTILLATITTIALISGIIIMTSISTSSTASAQEAVPDWIKNIAGWWATGQILEEDFLYGIEWLINEDIIKFADAQTKFAHVPIGAVIDWWRPNNSYPIPEGYQICDGTIVTDLESPLVNQKLPDLRNKFVLGARDLSYVGQEGGSTFHNHLITSMNAPTTTNGNHDHTVDPPYKITESSTHKHLWASFGAKVWRTYDSAGNFISLISWEDGMDNAGAGYYPITVQSSATRFLYTAQSSHSHSIDFDEITSSTTGNHNHFVNIGSHSTQNTDSMPPHINLVKICRTK